ncbi:MAG: hypothetical protein AB7I36_16845 [Rhodospirillaceae bacterium]
MTGLSFVNAFQGKFREWEAVPNRIPNVQLAMHCTKVNRAGFAELNVARFLLIFVPRSSLYRFRERPMPFEGALDLWIFLSLHGYLSPQYLPPRVGLA